MVSLSRLARGRMCRSTGRSSRASFWLRPQRSISVITPLHRQMAPAMEMHSSTAARAPSMAAADTAPHWPLIPPNTSANAKKAVKK